MNAWIGRMIDLGGGGVTTVPASAGRARLLALLHRVLATRAWEGEGPTDLAGPLRQLERLARRRGVVVVISDFLCQPGWEAALGRLGRALVSVGVGL